MWINTECGQFLLPVNAPSGRCSPPPRKGFSSLVYLRVSNTKPHIPYVKQDFRGWFQELFFALYKRSAPLRPDFSGHWSPTLNHNFFNQWNSLTEREAPIFTDSLWWGGSICLDMGAVGLGLCWVQTLTLLVLAVWDPEQVTWLL